MIVQAMYAGGKPVKEACNRDIVSIPFDAPLRTGTRIYRTLDSSLMKELQSSFEQPGRYRKVPVSLGVQASVGEHFVVTVRDEDGNSVSAGSDYIIEAALRKATAMEDIHKQMNKLGNTAFELKAIEINMEDGVFIPIKEMNDTRNKAIAELERIRTEGHRRKRHAAYTPVNVTHSTENTKKTLLAVSISNMESLQDAIASGADAIYYDMEHPTEKSTDLQDIAVHAKNAHVLVYLHTPLIVKDEEMPDVQEQMLTAMKAGFEGIIAANSGVFRRALSLGFKTITDSSFNVFNRRAASVLLGRGAELIVLSPEMNFEQVKEVSAGIKTECIVHGKLHVMESEHCLVAALAKSGSTPGYLQAKGSFWLRDEKGFIFPVMTDERGRTHIFNSKEMCLLEDIPRLVDAGVSMLRIDARIAEPSLTGQIVASYREAIDSCYDKSKAGGRKCRDISAEFTRGHYHRGVL